AWAQGRTEITPAPRKKRGPHGGRGRPPSAPPPPPRLSFLLPETPGGSTELGPEEEPEPVAAAARLDVPAAMRHQQARIRRAALIAQQLGQRDLAFEFVDFMAVEDLAARVPFADAVREVARREGRQVEEIEESWHEAVARIAADERCRYVDALRPY